MQQEFYKMQGEFSQLDVKIDTRLETRLQGFKNEFKGEIISKLKTLRFELSKLLEQYFGSPVVPKSAIVKDRGMGVMWSRPPPLGFSPKGSIEIAQPSIVISAHHP